MNKIHTINLGGHPYTMDEDALEYLQAYIRSLNKHFKNSPGCEEIISDIETRLAELLSERMEGKQIVTLREVKEVISIMGSPEEFGADPIDEKIIDPNRVRKDHQGRKLFRDPDDKIISGVCSGIAAYFGIQDPVWVRLIFGLMMIGGGIGLPLYIILRIIMPKADSAADRLAMKGEPIDYQSIAKTIQDEIEHLSKEFGTMDSSDETMKKQWDATKSVAGKGLKAGAGILNWFFSLLNSILHNILPIALKIAAIVAIVFMCFVIIGLIFGWSMLWPYAPYFFSGPKALSALSMMNAFFLVLIPLVFVIFLGARMYNGTRLPKSLAAGLGGLWILNLMGGAFVGINTARQFSDEAEINKSIYEGNFNADVLNVEVGEVKDRNDFFKLSLGSDIWIEDDRIVRQNVPIHIQESEDNQFHIYQNNIAAGSSTGDAKRRAQNLGTVARIDGNQLFVNNFIELDKKEKMRNQHSSIFISVPIGKKVKIGQEVHPVDGQRDESQHDYWNMGGKTWTMTKNGLICPDLKINQEDTDLNDMQNAVGEATQEVKKAVDEVKERVKEIKEEVKEEIKKQN